MTAMAQLLRCAPLATWCLVGLGAATLFLGRLDNHFDGLDARLDRMDARMDRIEGDIQQFRGEVNSRFDRLETMLMQQPGQ